MVIYPGKVLNADCFRIGNIGHLFPYDMTSLLDIVEVVCQDMGIKVPVDNWSIPTLQPLRPGSWLSIVAIVTYTQSQCSRTAESTMHYRPGGCENRQVEKLNLTCFKKFLMLGWSRDNHVLTGLHPYTGIAVVHTACSTHLMWATGSSSERHSMP